MVLAKIKKYYLFIIVFCFSINISRSQSFEKIQSTDTLYIYFKNDNINQIKARNNVVNRDNYDYYFYFSIETTTVRQYYVLFNHYLITPEVKWEKRSFLKEKKDIIVDYELLKKLGYYKSEKLLLQKKKIYIIDRDNFCKSKIKLVEAKITERTLSIE
ncbi:hypothetical protein [Flavobacterium quisquiliarum]|uniref:Uncharacterized protein n=1 Tax=Flavobacterium quisquiliarum TaxID=1834436 RepID=A0ABV8WAT2_9FLAO|nr:hypothetical protein [Flavobacterium quisquiliarum]MBW1657772.1 hypothetical protein [Flavobacterium quisquiliarum]NWL04111.1 hypothetical protein [Flavobacterium collinsii]